MINQFIGLKELEDLHCFPSRLRNFQTEFTGFVVSRFNFYGDFVKYINSLSLTQQPMADLCSGSGEPAISIFRKSTCFTHLTLSDKFPNCGFIGDKNISYLPQSMDVLGMEFQPEVCYTMFNAFHHFSDQEKLKIVEKLSATGSQGFFVEVLEPGIICLLKVLFITTVGNFFLSPFIKPFSFTRLLLTYLIPLNILTITYDGIISVFKARSLKTYRKLFSAPDNSVMVLQIKSGLRSLLVIRVQPGNKND